ncbi:MAG: iron-siderophore ABC transporter substrate-binding protein [Kineosporiaceae bacterium]
MPAPSPLAVPGRSVGARSPRRRGVRRALAVAVASGLTATIAACGGSAPSSTSPAETVSGSPSGTPAAYPVSIAHRYGRTSIEKEPQRIVTVGLMEQDAVLALGKVPVATTEWFGEQPGAIFPWAKDELAGRPLPQVLKTTDGIQFEKIAALKPDLILGMYSALTKEDYEKLSKIAPTIAQPEGQKDWTASWQEITRTTAIALGQQEKAESLISFNEGIFANARRDHPDWQGAPAVMAGLYQGVFAYGSQDARGRLLGRLGFTVPKEIDEISGTGFGGVISNEKLDLLDGSAMIWLMTDYAPERKTIDANPVYPTLKVSKEGRDIFVASSKDGAYYAATSFITVLSIPHLLETLIPQLEAATDGDPTTVRPGVGSKAAESVQLSGLTS